MEKMYLSNRIAFGRYRDNPMSIKQILDTPDGRSWFRWFMKNNWGYIITPSVIEYYETKNKEDAGRLLQPEGSK
jgi:hypothetical protein